VSNQVEGRCLCSAVRFVARGEPAEMSWCHCQSCRRHTGAPASAFVAFRRDAYDVTEGEITKFNSSPGRLRGFCARCGSTMTCEGEGLPEIQFHIGTFTYEDASRFRPTKQFFPEERLPWVHPTDDAPVSPHPQPLSRKERRAPHRLEAKNAFNISAASLSRKLP
jgi:hypothetical protein